MNHLKINQDNTRTETNVDDNALELIYQELKEVETHDQDTLIGRIEVKHGYEDAVNFLNGNYSKFRCISTETPYIRFVDSAMEQYIINRLIESNMECDGIGLTQSNLDQIRQGYFFDSLRGNTEITRFPEFNRLSNFTVMNGQCFRDCSNLEEVNLSNITSITAGSCLAATKILTVNLPNCTEINASGVFYNCKSLTEFNAPVLTNIISSGMFDGCTNLKTVNIPQLEYIGSNNSSNQSTRMFFNCNELTTVNVPNLSTTIITSSMFQSCKKLENLNMNLSNITRINSSGFYQCHMLDLSSLSFEKITKIEGQAFVEDTLPETIDLSECTYIGNEAFKNCKNLVNVVNTSNVIEIIYSAFENITTLTTFDDFSNITHIGQYAFKNTNLSGEIDLSSCTDIRNNAFNNTKITRVINTYSLERLESYVFANCSELTYIDSLENVTNFVGQEREFENCINLEGEINLSGITNKPNLTGNFNNCSKIKRIILGNIGYLGSRWHGFENNRQAFNGCTSLHTLDIKSLEYLSFCYWIGIHTCTNLVNIIIRNTTPPPPLDEYSSSYPGPINITYFSPNPNCKIYVPDEALNDYKTASYWSDVADYIFPLSEYIPMSVD